MFYPTLSLQDSEPQFPDPRYADPQGLLAQGGDLSVERLLAAYRAGIFPWFDELPVLWWCPDPRAVMTVDRLRVSRSLRRSMRRDGFLLSSDQNFAGVIAGCADERPEGTWIVEEMKAAYLRLHQAGHAHSFEVWHHGELVGGLYGVHCGGVFAAESMFHKRTNASKVGLVFAVRWLHEQGVPLMDVQFLTPHLASMGAYLVRRADFLAHVAQPPKPAPAVDWGFAPKPSVI